MKNIYIKAMEVGFNKLNGLKYPELKQEIEDGLGSKLNQDSENGLIEWFLNSFTSTRLTPN